jgi:hypothetical protein
VAAPAVTVRQCAGVFGPPKLPREIVERLNKEVNAALKRPDVLEKLQSYGARDAATEHLLLNALAVPVVDLGSPFAALAKSRCRAVVVRAFQSGWDWSGEPCCAPRRRTRSGTSGGGRRRRSCMAW